MNLRNITLILLFSFIMITVGHSTMGKIGLFGPQDEIDWNSFERDVRKVIQTSENL